MFNVIRSAPAPVCLSKKIYNHETVVSALEKMFHGKCYLCEQDGLSDPEIEHFVPHGKLDSLKYDWSNLYLSCSRCNSIKGDHHVNLLDCSDSTVNVFDDIIHLAGFCINGEIDIRSSNENPDLKTQNTILLLTECFNLENTDLRRVSKESLMEKIQGHYYHYMTQRMILVNKQSSEKEIEDVKDKLKSLCRVSYPFSVFWRWHILTDVIIKKRFPNIRAELEF